jgi:acetyl esterase/lipase
MGENEGLLKSTQELHEKLIAQNIPHNFHVEPKMFHVYPIFRIKEAQLAFQQMEDLIKN